MTDHPTTPPAGWYADPGGSDDLRWWDGTAWTPHTHADPASTTTASASSPTTDAPSPSPSASPSPSPSSPAGADVPWWAQSSDGKPPSWWADGTPDQRAAWDSSQAVGDRRGPADPRTFGVPGATPESGAAPMASPYAHTRSPVPLARADGAVKALVLGIVALVCCGFLGPFAIYEGMQVRYRVRTSNGRLDGDGFAIAGIVLGIIATAFLVIGIILAATGNYPLTTSSTGGR